MHWENYFEPQDHKGIDSSTTTWLKITELRELDSD